MKSFKLSLKTKTSYGFAEMGINAVEVMAQIYLLKFYTDYVGLQPGYAGLALLIAVLWDAFSDPIMGRISDNTISRYGRRRPYILIGGILLSISGIALFAPPAFDSQLAKFFYLLFSYIIVNTCMTIIAVPHIALGGELSFDRDERTELFGWRLFFGNLGLLSGMVLPVIYLKLLDTNSPVNNIANSRLYAMISIAIILIISSITTFSMSREKATHSAPKNIMNFWQSFRSVLQNRVFLPLLGAFIIATFGRTFNSAIALYYYEYRLQLSEQQFVPFILLPFVFVILLSIGFWIFISKKLGKKMPAFWGIFFLGLMTIIVYPLFPPGKVAPPLFAAIFGGIMAGSILLFDSILADIVDYDEWRTKEHREGLYFGFWKMATKIARAFGLATTGFMLEILGFDKNAAVQNAEFGQNLALLFGPGVGFFFILGGIIFLWMPLTDEKHKKIQKFLKKRNEKRIKSIQPSSPKK